MGYLIKWTPYTWEENCNDEWYRNLCDHIYEFFEENNTAYIVMELLQGVALNRGQTAHESQRF